MVRQVTTHSSIHHYPFFFVEAYDDQMRHLVFISHRTGRPQIFLEILETGELFQITDEEDLDEWSVIPSRDGRWVYYIAGQGGFRVNPGNGDAEQLVSFGDAEMREQGMVGAAMGTTALSASGRWWAVPVRYEDRTRFWMIDTQTGSAYVFLEKATIGHPQFCPDDEDLILYAGPMTDRVWVTDAQVAKIGECMSARMNYNGSRMKSGDRAIARSCSSTGRMGLARSMLQLVQSSMSLTSRLARCSRSHRYEISLRYQFPGSRPAPGRFRSAACLPAGLSSSPASKFHGRTLGKAVPILQRSGKSLCATAYPSAPTVFPDGDQIVFTSDRTGHAQVYVASIQG